MRYAFAVALLLLASAAPADARHGRHYHPHRHGYGWGAPVFGGLIIGGALTAAMIAEQRDREYRRDRCERDFPTYDRYAGTVLIDGIRRVCPYL